MLQHSTLDSSTQLDPFPSSPVRGQLDAYDAKTPKGWRYIQTTDTPNQLKVLLPPGTASMYEQLLKFEVFELKKKSAVSWERILEIRHLKDRMIRKCQKLAKNPSSRKPGDPFSFQTIIAPSDFRVKAMEKWFQQQQKRTNALLRQPPARSTEFEISHPERRNTERVYSPGVLPGLSSSKHQSRQMSVPSTESTRLHELPEARPLPQQSRWPPSIDKSVSLPTRSAVTLVKPPSSPPPLPHLLRLRDPKTGYDLSIDPQKFISHLSSPDPKNLLPDSESAPIPPKQELDMPRPEIRRRRSCIKRSSLGDFVKTVSWADDGELAAQVSKYSSVAHDVYASGRKWEEIRDIYVEQMAGLEILQEEVEKSLNHIRSESEHLMRTDETLRRHRSVLQSTFQELERKQVLLHAKGDRYPAYPRHPFSPTIHSASRARRRRATVVAQQAQPKTNTGY